EGEFTDAELLTVLRVGELCHWLRPVRASYQALFPALPTDGQFSRRAQGVREADRPRLAGQLVDLHLGPGQPAAVGAGAALPPLDPQLHPQQPVSAGRTA